MKEREDAPLAGKILTCLPIQIWFCENPQRSDVKFESDLLALVPAKTLLLLDRGFYHFQFFADLIVRRVHFITRLKAKAHLEVESVLSTSYAHKDQIICLGTKCKNTPQVRLRLIQICFGETRYSYLTSVLEPEVLPPFVVADLYHHRWRIEEAFSTVKRLLGLIICGLTPSMESSFKSGAPGYSLLYWLI